ncbi:MAG: GAF domain-containing protein [Verrucomicrobiales bacterium]|nr:GAF domain-containing protein [Verrucomicrobiales bacterium]
MDSQLLQPDTALSEHASLIEQRLEDCAKRLQPEDMRDLLGPASRELVSVTVGALRGDSASLWLVDADHSRLIVSHVEPMDPDMMNREQPVDEGLVGLVLGSGQAVCENKVYENTQHSKRTDAALGTITCAMIAVPFYTGGTLRGVLSCVKLKDSEDDPDPDDFTAADLNRAKRLSSGLERLLNYRMLVAILGLEL